MKKLYALLSALVCLCLLVGCAGTPVIYHMDCDCPTTGTNTPNAGASDETKPVVPDVPAAEGDLKTGLAIAAGIGDSVSATAEKDGEAKYDVTFVAVLVDQAGIIRDCSIDGVSASVKFDKAGHITTDLATAPQTKNELGDKYGMVAYGGAIAEWDVQAAALADFAVGKTVEQLRNGAVDETGKAPAGSDLASSATIYLGGYVSAIEKAVANAEHLGAKSGDSLKMAAVTSIASSDSADAENAGNAQLDVTVTALTTNGDVITSCAFDAVQAKVGFDSTGVVTSDLTAPVPTKNELGEKYGMVAWGGAIAEWDAQAAAFAAYVTGKTPVEVTNIAVNERTSPTEADLVSSVTMAVGDFKALIQKAAQ